MEMKSKTEKIAGDCAHLCRHWRLLSQRMNLPQHQDSRFTEDEDEEKHYDDMKIVKSSVSRFLCREQAYTIPLAI